MSTEKTVFVRIEDESEEGSRIVSLTVAQVKQLKKLFKAAQPIGEYPEDANTILDSAKRVAIAGTVNTTGDCWGWEAA